jgi:hypothetical protein
METFINILNNREKALIIWVLIGLVCILVNKNIRKSFLSLLKALFARKIVIALFVMVSYISLAVFATYKLHVWDISLLKDTIIWGLGTAFIMFMNYDKANTERKYFRKVLLDNVKLVVLLEFIINLYVFNFVVEFLLVPILFVVIGMLGVSGTKKEYKPVKNLLQIILAIYGIFLIIFALVHVVGDFKDFATIYNIKDFLLSPLLTVSFLPFVYFLVLYTTYESLFTRMDIFLRDQNKELIRFAKRQILRACLFNLKKLNRFSMNYTTQLMSIKNKSDIVSLTRQFRVSSRS